MDNFHSNGIYIYMYIKGEHVHRGKYPLREDVQGRISWGVAVLVEWGVVHAP